MTLELGLLLLESVLLLFTIVLLFYSIKEGKQRDKLIMEVSRATRVLTRQEYFLSAIDSMMNAKEEIVGCITGRTPSGDDVGMTGTIIENIKQKTKQGVRITYILPKFPDRLHIGCKYMAAGADIRYSSCLMVHNMRFIIVDEKTVVMGIPESIGEREATKKGYRIPSEGLAMVLKNYFKTCEKQLTLKEYLNEVLEQTGASAEHIAKEYKINVDDLRRLLR